MGEISSRKVAVIVAHPDDETLWAGGTILSHPSWRFFIVSLCRGNDNERAPKFYSALKVLNSKGIMGNLDDGPDQRPLDENELGQTILDLLPVKHFDLIITHNPSGEYTRHIRHEEVSAAVIKLWHANKITAHELWTFAYEDGNKTYYPRSVVNAPVYKMLTKRIWQRKYDIMTRNYGFDKTSWEANTTPKSEAFWQFTDPDYAKKWIKKSAEVEYKNKQ